MRVLTSQLTGEGRNADRVLVTENAVLVLDGASAFERVPVEPGQYAEALGQAVARYLASDPYAVISDAVAAGIASTADTFDLWPGHSPSSTVAVVRSRGNLADLFVLGDSPIHYGTSASDDVLRDDRLSEIAEPERTSYIEALRAGRGYSGAHRDSLRALQRAQRDHRNAAGGYWIAEADPTAAYQAFTTTVNAEQATWAVIGTDGATEMVQAVTTDSWGQIACYDQAKLDALLACIHQWESDADPSGQCLPRAKRHDDKTLAVIRQLFS